MTINVSGAAMQLEARAVAALGGAGGGVQDTVRACLVGFFFFFHLRITWMCRVSEYSPNSTNSSASLYDIFQ